MKTIIRMISILILVVIFGIAVHKFQIVQFNNFEPPLVYQID